MEDWSGTQTWIQELVLQALDQHKRIPLVVVEPLLLHRQILDLGALEAMLDEPVRRVRGEAEQLLQLALLGLDLDTREQRSSATGTLIVRMHGYAGEFAHVVFGEGEQRAAGDGG